MKQLKIGLPILAFVLAIAASAFTTKQALDSDLVWFEVHPTTGQALDASSGGREGDEPQISCPGTLKFCATALSISDNEVVDNGDGTFGIAPGVNITSSAYYDDMRKKNQ